MASVFAHAAAALGSAVRPTRAVVGTRALLVVVPDLDVLAFAVGHLVRAPPFGHRSLALAFAAVLCLPWRSPRSGATRTAAAWRCCSPSRRPRAVSPIGVEAFFSARGLRMLASEAVWVFLPSMGLALAGWAFRRRRAARGTP